MSQNEFDMSKFPKTGQRLTLSTHDYDIHNQENPAIFLDPDSPADVEELAKDALGFTNPNLHRRLRVNEWHDGKKIYTITEPFTTEEAVNGVQPIYRTKYQIQDIKYIFISGIPVQSISDSVKLVEDTELNIVIGFRFNSGYAPSPNLPMEVIYETPLLIDDEVTYRDYDVGISGVYSYRTTKITLHTEEDEGDRNHRIYENEIP